MGFFSRKKKVYVATATYNLAGDQATRTNVLSTMIVGSAINGKSFTDSLIDSITTGQAAKLKGYARWAKASGYTDLIGLQAGALSTTANVPPSVLIPHLPNPQGGDITVQSVKVDLADYTYFSDMWIMDTYPERINTDYVTDLVDGTNQVQITWENGTTSLIYINGFDSSAKYIYADYTVTTQVNDKPFETVKFFIYKQGSGKPQLDAYFVSVGSKGIYYPPLPLRIDNKFISKTNYADLWSPVSVGTQKALGTSSTKIINMLADNDSINDLDYAYVFFGAALNSKDNGVKRYLFEYFNQLFLDEPVSGMQSYGVWQEAWKAAGVAAEKYNDWYYDYSWVDKQPTRPLPPPIPTFPSVPSRNVRLSNGGRAEINLDFTVSWNGIQRAQGSGRCKPHAKIGDVFVEAGSSLKFNRWGRQRGGFIEDTDVPLAPIEAYDVDVINIFHQTKRNEYTVLTVYGLNHRNLIYGGKSVDIGAKEAMEDVDESGFLIPLHEEVFNKLPLIQANQCGTSCNYVVINCYQVVKQKWYQTGLFRIIVIVIAIVISIFFPPAGGAAGGAGVLGANAAVGVALGAAAGTLTAVIIGAIANAVAAMVIGQLIMKGSTALLGDKIGSIFGAIASLVVIGGATGMNSAGQTFAESFANLFSADNWLQLSNSASAGFSGFMQADAADTMSATASMMASYNQQMQQISTAMESLGHSGVDPNVWLNSLETSQQFLDRTLLTGMDIATMTNEMISSYVDINLSTNLSGT